MGWLKMGAERQIDTACAHVFLKPDAAWKMKRHADLGYADFSTLERRQWALDRELEFNKAAAPDIYRAVRHVTREADGTLALGGRGEVVDHVLEMRRFDETAVLSARPEAVDGDLAETLGRTIAGYHAGAPLRPAGGLTALAYTVGSNAQLLRETCDGLDQARVEEMIALTEVELERQAPLLAHRAATGFSRRCHGDLHLGNICLLEGRPTPFDALEFDEALATIDVGYDLAFLLMDLEQRDSRAAANRVLNRYLARTGDVALLRALPLWLSLRALIRAHVAARSGQDGGPLLAAALGYLRPAPARLVAVGGLQGTGKSYLARRLAPDLGAAPGALILRSDEIRKRQAGVAPETRLPPEAYSTEASAAVFAALNAMAAEALAAGHAVIADAVFQRAPERDALAALGATLGAKGGHGFTGFWLEAPIEILRARIAARQGDASDATAEVLAATAAREAGEITWNRLDAASGTEDMARKILDLPPAPSP